jgi:hypothetical protein
MMLMATRKEATEGHSSTSSVNYLINLINHQRAATSLCISMAVSRGISALVLLVVALQLSQTLILAWWAHQHHTVTRNNNNNGRIEHYQYAVSWTDPYDATKTVAWKKRIDKVSMDLGLFAPMVADYAAILEQERRHTEQMAQTVRQVH